MGNRAPKRPADRPQSPTAFPESATQRKVKFGARRGEFRGRTPNSGLQEFGVRPRNSPMRAVIQRVTSARVLINEMEYSRIGRGLLALVGVEKEDTDEDAVALARRIVELRIFEDDAGKMNRSI